MRFVKFKNEGLLLTMRRVFQGRDALTRTEMAAY